MYEITNKSLFNTGSQVIVNAVNCVGVMGSGIALEFKLRYPDMYKDYADKCSKGQVRIGEPYLYGNVLNFPTKNHWTRPSKIEWIEEGILHFVKAYKDLGITSIAFPKLGCGHGGLDWRKVQKIMDNHLSGLNDIDIKVCLDTDEAEGLEKKMIDYVVSKNPNLILKRFRDLKIALGDNKEAYEKCFIKAFEKATT